MSKRNLRKKPRISYYELEEPDLDEYVFCDECRDYVYEYCAIHGPLLVLPDDKVPSPTGFPDFVPYAALTIPQEFLHLAPSNIPGAGIGVFATLTLPKGVRFGPYRGVRTKNADSEYCWQIYSSSGGGRKPSHAVDAADAGRSNWMRYVNCSRHSVEQNLLAYQYQGELYYRTIKLVPRFSELLVFYGAEFARSLRIDLRLYDKVEGLQMLIGDGSSVKKKPILANNNTSKQQIEEKPNIETSVKLSAVEKTVESHNSFEESVAQTCVTTELPKPTPTTNNATKWKPPQKKQKKNKTHDANNSKLSENSDNNAENSSKITNENSASRTVANITECKKSDNISKKTHSKISNENTSINTIAPTLDSTQDKNNNLLTDNIYECDLCNEKFTLKDHLSSHLKIHTQVKLFACEICKKRFTTKSSLNIHLKIHTGVKSYVCDICNKKFGHKHVLNSHLRIHTGEKPYSCDICNKNFTLKHHLNVHLRIHTGVKPFACDICNESFTHKNSLDMHFSKHTGIKPYACDICNKKFTLKGHLNMHIRIHTGEKPYACDICNKKFIVKGDLDKHIRIHTGEKPYSCEICDKKFSQNSHLHKHLRTHAVAKPGRKS